MIYSSAIFSFCNPLHNTPYHICVFLEGGIIKHTLYLGKGHRTYDQLFFASEAASMGFKSNMYDTFLPSVYPSSVEYFLNSSDSNSSGSPDDFSGMSDSEDTSDELTYSNFGDFDMSSSDESTA